jgi:predicted metal-dependent hydrolase
VHVPCEAAGQPSCCESAGRQDDPHAAARKTGAEASRIEVRDLDFRWGSYGKNGIFFNWRLPQLPVRLIDYVIIHELVYFQKPHHSPEF